MLEIWKAQYEQLDPELKAYIEYAAELFVEIQLGVKRPYQLHLFMTLEETMATK